MSEADVNATPLLLPAGGVPAIIDSENQLQQAIKSLKDLTGPIAVDAERASGYRYSARAYLIQIKRGKEIFLIDPIPFIGSPLVNELNQIIQRLKEELDKDKPIRCRRTLKKIIKEIKEWEDVLHQHRKDIKRCPHCGERLD